MKTALYLFFGSAIFGILICGTSTERAFASANDCNARVALEKSERAADGTLHWVLTFKVATDCENSTGRFQYRYRTVPGSTTPSTRTVAMWNAGNGKAFTWSDEISLPSGHIVQFDKVLLDTIESTRLK